MIPHLICNSFFYYALDQLLSFEALCDFSNLLLLCSNLLLLFHSHLLKEMHVVQVDCVKIHRLSITFWQHTVYMSQVLAVASHQVIDRVSDQHSGAIALSGSFKTRSHVDIRAEIASVDFIL